MAINFDDDMRGGDNSEDGEWHGGGGDGHDDGAGKTDGDDEENCMQASRSNADDDDSDDDEGAAQSDGDHGDDRMRASHDNDARDDDDDNNNNGQPSNDGEDAARPPRDENEVRSFRGRLVNAALRFFENDADGDVRRSNVENWRHWRIVNVDVNFVVEIYCEDEFKMLRGKTLLETRADAAAVVELYKARPSVAAGACLAIQCAMLCRTKRASVPTRKSEADAPDSPFDNVVEIVWTSRCLIPFQQTGTSRSTSSNGTHSSSGRMTSAPTTGS